MITDELIKVKAKHDIGEDTVIEGEKRVLKKAEEKGDLPSAIKVLATWAGRCDLNPTEVKETKFRDIIQVDYKAMLEDAEKRELGSGDSESE